MRTQGSEGPLSSRAYPPNQSTNFHPPFPYPRRAKWRIIFYRGSNLPINPHTVKIIRKKLRIAITAPAAQDRIPRIQILRRDILILRELGAVIAADRLGIIITFTRNARLRGVWRRDAHAVIVIGEQLRVAVSAVATEDRVPGVEVVGRDIVLLGELRAVVPADGLAVLVAVGREAGLRRGGRCCGGCGGWGWAGGGCASGDADAVVVVCEQLGGAVCAVGAEHRVPCVQVLRRDGVALREFGAGVSADGFGVGITFRCDPCLGRRWC